MVSAPAAHTGAAATTPPASAAWEPVRRAPHAYSATPAPVPAFLLRPVEQLNTPLPSLESTQTLRPITPLELENEDEARWFVIQLSLSEEPFNPDTLPNLDIFNEYRLYSVAGPDQDRLMHALRLGFFAESVAAGAVASYLAAFYEHPTVKRVSAAERERFAERRMEARKDIGATGRHAVIEITSERVIRENRGATVSVLPFTADAHPGQNAARKI